MMAKVRNTVLSGVFLAPLWVFVERDILINSSYKLTSRGCLQRVLKDYLVNQSTHMH